MAQIIGGILDSCGIKGFLSNHQESLSEIDATQDILLALFETTMEAHKRPIAPEVQTVHIPSLPQSSLEWLPVVTQSGVAEADLASARTDRGKAVKIGILFSGLLNREFNVEFENRSGKARLIKVDVSSKRVGYQFKVVLAPVELLDSNNTTGAEASEDSSPPPLNSCGCCGCSKPTSAQTSAFVKC